MISERGNLMIMKCNMSPKQTQRIILERNWKIKLVYDPSQILTILFDYLLAIFPFYKITIKCSMQYLCRFYHFNNHTKP